MILLATKYPSSFVVVVLIAPAMLLSAMFAGLVISYQQSRGKRPQVIRRACLIALGLYAVGAMLSAAIWRVEPAESDESEYVRFLLVASFAALAPILVCWVATKYSQLSTPAGALARYAGMLVWFLVFGGAAWLRHHANAN